MSNSITTYTGKHLQPRNPDPDLICVEDIAHALSMTCRANGHIKSFWSVAQHCICCAREAVARGLSDRMVLACLLHDATECYLSDIPSPFKHELPEYRKYEEHLLNMIYEKYLGRTLTEEEEIRLKEIDNAFLWYDLTTLLDEELEEEKPEIHFEIDYSFRPFKEAEEEYLEMFYRYASKLM